MQLHILVSNQITFALLNALNFGRWVLDDYYTLLKYSKSHLCHIVWLTSVWVGFRWSRYREIFPSLSSISLSWWNNDRLIQQGKLVFWVFASINFFNYLGVEFNRALKRYFVNQRPAKWRKEREGWAVINRKESLFKDINVRKSATKWGKRFKVFIMRWYKQHWFDVPEPFFAWFEGLDLAPNWEGAISGC